MEDIVKGAVIRGLSSDDTVTIINTEWYGNDTIEVTYKDNKGQLGDRILYREDEATVEKLKEMRINIRCIPFDQSGTEGECLLSGKKATLDVIYARSY